MSQRSRRTLTRLAAPLLAAAVILTGLPRMAAAEEEGEASSVSASPSAEVFLAVGPLDPPDLPLVERTERSNIFRLPDGNQAMYAYAGPVNWKGSDGAWHPIDPSVVSDGLGGFRNRSGSLTFTFAPVSGLGPLVRAAGEGWSAGFTLEGMFPGVPGLPDAHKVRYPGVLPGADLEYEVGRDRLKEVVVLSNPAAAGTGVFRFPLTLSGVSARTDADGSIGLYDPADVRVARIPQGVAFDSSGDPALGQDPRTAPVAIRLVEGTGQPVVEVEAPRSLLDDPATVWPVRVDPGFEAGKATESWDSYVRSNCGSCNQNGAAVEALGGQLDGSNAVAKVGYSGGVEYDSYFLYDVAQANNQNILRADWVGHLWGNGVGNRYVLWPVSGAYDPNTVTFNTRPNHFGGGVCDNGNSKCVYDLRQGWLVNENRPDMRTWVHNWTHGIWNNRGIVADTAGDTATYARLGSDDDLFNSGSYLYIVFNTPSTLSNLSPVGGYQTTTTPTLCAKMNDPNPDTGYVVWDVYTGGGGLIGRITSGNVSAAGGTACATVPGGWLGEGLFQYWAYGYDFYEWGPGAYGSSTVDTVAPGVASISGASHPESPPGPANTSWRPTRTFSATLSGPSDTSGIAGYSVTVDQSPGTLPGTTVNVTSSYTNNTSITADGQWYVHARAKDNAGWWSGSARHYGLLADSTRPTAPTILTSSHPKFVCTSTPTVTMSWAAGTDATSGVLGYSWVFNNDQAAAADNSVETSVLSNAPWTAPADGTYWFHLATVDRAGNQSNADQVFGPICIDSTASPVELSPTLLPDMVAQSDQVGLEQFAPYRSFPLGTGTGYAQLRSGNLVATFDDATIPGQGLNTVIRHVYNSQRQSTTLHDNGLGQGWSLSVSDLDGGLEGVEGSIEDLDLTAPITAAKATVVDGAGTITGYLLEFTDGDGTTHRFIRKGGIGARWDSPPGVSLRVREISSGTPAVVTAYEFIRPDGVIYKAENVKTLLGLSVNTWKVTSVRDRLGNTLTFGYALRAGKVRLITVTHSRNGVVASLDWNTTTGYLNEIKSLPGVSAVEPVTGTTRSYERRVGFTYTGAQLTKITENLQAGSDALRTTDFTYTGGLLASVKDGRAKTTLLGYTGSGYTAQLASITDRRQAGQPSPKLWAFAYGVPDPTTGIQDTVVTSPVSIPVTYRTSGRAAVQPAGVDRRIAGGNVISITDAGYGAGQVVAEFEWAENRLTKRYEPRLVATPRPANHPVWSNRYNDIGFLIEVTEPIPNDPTRTDLPGGAPMVTVRSTFTYKAVKATSPDSFRYPTGCVDPVVDTNTISEEGYCLAVMELERSTAAAGDTAQRVSDFTYNANGTIETQTQRANSSGAPDAVNDRTTGFTYYPSGALRAVDGSRPSSDVSDVTVYGDTADAANGAYDRTGAPIKITDAASKAKTFQYNPYGPVAKETDRDARVTKSRYDDRDNLVEVVDPRGNRTTFTYDANDNKTRETSPRGQLTGDADDFTTIWTYDDNDWLTQTSLPGANPTDARRLSSATYAGDGVKLTETTPRSASAVNYGYTPNRALKTTDAPGHTAAPADRAVTDSAHDPAGRVIQVDGPVANATAERPRTTLSYTPSGALARSQVIANATQTQVTSTAYNAHGELLQTKGPGKVGTFDDTTEHTFNAFGEVTRNRRYKSATSFVDSEVGYDRAGNQVRTTQPTGTGASLESLYAYNALNRLSAQTKDPANPTHTVTYAYDGEGHQTERLDKDGATALRRVNSVFNPDGTLQSEVAKNETAATTLATCNYPAGATDLTTGYDADANLAVTRTISGTTGCGGTTTLKTQTFGYAAANDWLTSSTQTLRSPENGLNYSRTQNYTYETDGAFDTLTHDGRATSFDHAPSGWLTSLTDWRARVSANTYFPSGAIKTGQVNNAALVGTSDYQRGGAPSSLTWKAGTNVLRSHTALAYDLAGRRTQETVAVRQPGATSTVSGTATFAYDALDRLTSWVAPFAEPTDSARNTVFALDDGGNVTGEIVRDGTTAGSGAITADGASTFANGRLTSRQTTVPGFLGLDSYVCETFAYSALGEETTRSNYTETLLTCDPNPSADRTTTYDPAGQVAAHDDLSLNQYDANYVYDGGGRLLARSDPYASGSAKTALYFYWGTTDSLAEETDGTGQAMVRYLADDEGDTIAQESFRSSTGSRNATAVWTWLLPDLSGNVRTICDDTGGVVEQAAYDPYGAPKAGGAGKASGSAGSSLGHQAAITDRDPAGKTRAVMLGGRQYDPGVRRFTTGDSYVASGADLALGTDVLTGNRYLFAAANPVGFYEDGHRPTERDGAAPPSCRQYQPGRITDYMTGKLRPPCGFPYAPKRVVDTKAAPLLLVDDQGQCSDRGVLSSGARRAFGDSCRSHDYAYDLLRLAAQEGAFRLSDRRASDRQLVAFIGSVCSNTGWLGARLNKPSCRIDAGLVDRGLRGATRIEARFGSGAPSGPIRRG